MSTYIYKSINNLDLVSSISDDDILLVSQRTNSQLISKKASVNDIVNHIYPKIEKYVDECVDGYLPLTADINNVVLGEIYTTAQNAMSLHLLSKPLVFNGNSSKQKCGKIKLHSSESTYDRALTGGFELEANNNDNYTYSLKGYNNGSLKWNNKNIVRSINNNIATDDGNVTLSSVESANRLVKPITITLTGDLSGSVSFDGSSDICAHINNATNLSSLAFKDKILSSDIEGQLSASLIEGLRVLAFKDKILSSDLDDKLKISLIENLLNTLNSKINSVIVTPKLDVGTEIATIEVDGELTKLYAPEGSTIKGGVANIGIGTILPFAGIGKIPENTLLCDGSEVNILEYELLYNIIGNKYGTASEGKFRLPDLTNRFIEGCSLSSDVGTYLEAGLPNITGSGVPAATKYNTNDYSPFTGAFRLINAENYFDINNGATGENGPLVKFSASYVNPIYNDNCNTVQPPAVMMRYVIVYTALNGLVIVNGGNGGVIDGTILVPEQKFNTGTISDWSYTVKNDCMIYVYCDHFVKSFMVNGSRVTYNETNENGWLLAPVKANSIITATESFSLVSYPLHVIEYKLYGINSSSTTSYGNGGVIDGTVLYSQSNIQINTAKSDIYTVKNDCLLYGYVIKNGFSYGVRLSIGENEIFTNDDSAGTTNDIGSSTFRLPIKAGTIISGKSENTPATISFIEYKLIDTNPQLAFPNWDESKAKTISNGDTIPDNGWIYAQGQHDSNIKLNGVLVYETNWDGSSGYSLDQNSAVIPVSKNDNVSVTGTVSIKFYPAKVVAQPQLGVSYVIESGRFNSSDGTMHENNSENDSWYRLYSDGWCELGGYILDLTFNWSTCSVSLIKTYNNTNYTILYSIDRINNGVNMSVCYTTNKTTNSFEILKDNASVGAAILVGNISWETKGFIN